MIITERKYAKKYGNARKGGNGCRPLFVFLFHTRFPFVI